MDDEEIKDDQGSKGNGKAPRVHQSDHRDRPEAPRTDPPHNPNEHATMAPPTSPLTPFTKNVLLSTLVDDGMRDLLRSWAAGNGDLELLQKILESAGIEVAIRLGPDEQILKYIIRDVLLKWLEEHENAVRPHSNRTTPSHTAVTEAVEAPAGEEAELQTEEAESIENSDKRCEEKNCNKDEKDQIDQDDTRRRLRGGGLDQGEIRYMAVENSGDDQKEEEGKPNPHAGAGDKATSGDQDSHLASEPPNLPLATVNFPTRIKDEMAITTQCILPLPRATLTESDRERITGLDFIGRRMVEFPDLPEMMQNFRDESAERQKRALRSVREDLLRVDVQHGRSEISSAERDLRRAFEAVAIGFVWESQQGTLLSAGDDELFDNSRFRDRSSTSNLGYDNPVFFKRPAGEFTTPRESLTPGTSSASPLPEFRALVDALDHISGAVIPKDPPSSSSPNNSGTESQDRGLLSNGGSNSDERRPSYSHEDMSEQNSSRIGSWSDERSRKRRNPQEGAKEDEEASENSDSGHRDANEDEKPRKTPDLTMAEERSLAWDPALIPGYGPLREIEQGSLSERFHAPGETSQQGGNSQAQTDDRMDAIASGHQGDQWGHSADQGSYGAGQESYEYQDESHPEMQRGIEASIKWMQSEIWRVEIKRNEINDIVESGRILDRPEHEQVAIMAQYTAPHLGSLGSKAESTRARPFDEKDINDNSHSDPSGHDNNKSEEENSFLALHEAQQAARTHQLLSRMALREIIEDFTDAGMEQWLETPGRARFGGEWHKYLMYQLWLHAKRQPGMDRLRLDNFTTSYENEQAQKRGDWGGRGRFRGSGGFGGSSHLNGRDPPERRDGFDGGDRFGRTGRYDRGRSFHRRVRGVGGLRVSGRVEGFSERPKRSLKDEQESADLQEAERFESVQNTDQITGGTDKEGHPVDGSRGISTLDDETDDKDLQSDRQNRRVEIITPFREHPMLQPTMFHFGATFEEGCQHGLRESLGSGSDADMPTEIVGTEQHGAKKIGGEEGAEGNLRAQPLDQSDRSPRNDYQIQDVEIPGQMGSPGLGCEDGRVETPYDAKGLAEEGGNDRDEHTRNECETGEEVEAQFVDEANSLQLLNLRGGGDSNHEDVEESSSGSTAQESANASSNYLRLCSIEDPITESTPQRDGFRELVRSVQVRLTPMWRQVLGFSTPGFVRPTIDKIQDLERELRSAYQSCGIPWDDPYVALVRQRVVDVLLHGRFNPRARLMEGRRDFLQENFIRQVPNTAPPNLWRTTLGTWPIINQGAGSGTGDDFPPPHTALAPLARQLTDRLLVGYQGGRIEADKKESAEGDGNGGEKKVE